MGDYEEYTEQLREQATYPRNMLDVLEQYVTLGETHFRSDLIQAKRQENPNECHDNKKRRANLISDIQNDIRAYAKVRDDLMLVIAKIRIDPVNVQNEFAQHLFVNILRGEGFYDRYTEDIHYGLEDINGE